LDFQSQSFYSVSYCYS